MENGRCRIHGGKSLRGIAHPNYTNGERSRYRLAPGKLGERYTENLEDFDYMALRDELALVTAKVQELMEQEEGPTPLDVCQRCVSISRQQRLTDLVDLRRKLADTEAKRVKMAADTVSGEQIRTFGQAVLESCRRRATEFMGAEQGAAFLSSIQADVRAVMQAARDGSGV